MAPKLIAIKLDDIPIIFEDDVYHFKLLTLQKCINMKFSFIFNNIDKNDILLTINWLSTSINFITCNWGTYKLYKNIYHNNRKEMCLKNMKNIKR